MAVPGPRHVAEIGCGCGSSLLPVLTTNPESTATITDVSDTCILQLRAAAEAMGVDTGRRIVRSFACDSSDPKQVCDEDFGSF